MKMSTENKPTSSEPNNSTHSSTETADLDTGSTFRAVLPSSSPSTVDSGSTYEYIEAEVSEFLRTDEQPKKDTIISSQQATIESQQATIASKQATIESQQQTIALKEGNLRELTHEVKEIKEELRKLRLEVQRLRGLLQPTPLTNADIEAEITRFYKDE